MNRYISRSEAQEIPCPVCGAKSGEKCVGARGKPRESTHRERWNLAAQGVGGHRMSTLTLRGDKLVAPSGKILGRLLGLELDIDGSFWEEWGEPTERGMEGSSSSLPPDNPTANAQAGARPSEQLFETPGELEQLWAHYQETVDGAPRRKLDSTRRSCIRRALKVRSLDECKRAIDGLARSSWHNGDNPDRKKYLDIQYALGQKSESADERIDKAALWAHTASASPDRFEQVIAQLPDAAKVAFRRWRQDGRFGDLKRAGVIPIVSDGAITDWKYERPSDAS